MNKPSRGSTVSNEQGFVLVVGLLALLVITVLGVLALSTSTTEVIVSGNMRLREINFASAESGLELSIPTLKYAIYNDTFGNYSYIVNDSSLATELRLGPTFDPDRADAAPDLRFTLGQLIVSVDIDKMFAGPCEGAAIEFASGYEGIGLGGGGGICAYYRVNSIGQSDVGSRNVIGGVYRYVAY